MSTAVAASEARAMIAHHILSDAAASLVGSITLRAHQQDAVSQLRELLNAARGALLADDVGLGKTYVALALARSSLHPLIVGPAVLQDLWTDACQRTGVEATWESMESLSRTDAPAARKVRPDFVIVDEAHHFRNTHTRRYRALAAIIAGAPVLLLSATPIHNCPGDLAALLALFLGARAWHLDDAQRARYVVRRTHALAGIRHEVPDVAPPTWVSLSSSDDDTLADLLTLPPPVPPRDGADAGALLIHGLVRQWASSRNALRAALRRQLERGTALAAALEQGRHPSYRDLRAWCRGDGAVQLAFPELIIPQVAPDHADLSLAVARHLAAVRQVLDRLSRRPDPDVIRGQRLRELRQRHAGQKIVAFSAYAATVHVFYRLLRHEGAVCVLHADGAEVAGGSLTRAEALARFAPRAQGAAPPSAAHRITLLLTTDLLSEGVNLQDASVVVHLDLPWTAARLEQRVGRAARLGSLHPRVFVYAFRPPAAANRMLEVERLLSEKLSAASRAVGVVGSILPEQQATTIAASAPHTMAATRAALWRWRSETRFADVCDHGGASAGPVCAAVWSAVDGCLVVCEVDGTNLLLASVDGTAEVTDALADVARAIALAEGGEAPVDARACAQILLAVKAWASSRQAAQDVGMVANGSVLVRRRLLTRIAGIVQRVPHHARPHMAALAAAARDATLARSGIAHERALAKLVRAALNDEEWLRLVSESVPQGLPALTAREPAVSVVPRVVLLLRANNFEANGSA